MIARVYPCRRLPRALGWFDYQVPPGVSVEPGDVVTIQFRRHRSLGVVQSLADTSTVSPSKLLPLQPAVVPWRIPRYFLEFAEWVADRYAVAPGTVLQHSVFPARRATPGAFVAEPAHHPTVPAPTTVLYHRQAQAHAWLQSLRQSTTGRIALVCATTDAARQVASILPDALLLSGITDRERAADYTRLPTATTIIGTRSLLFTPLPALDAIVVYDDGHWLHGPSQQQPRAAVIPLAREYARRHGAACIGLTPAPSLKSVTAGTVTTLPGTSATIRLLPLGNSPRTRLSLHSTTLATLTSAAATAQPVFVYTAQRGFARIIRCRQCSWMAECPNCQRSLVRHEQNLQCHVCNYRAPAPATCPQCQQPELQSLLPGSAGIARQFAQQFPNATVLVDSDQQRPTRVDRPILIGTEFAWPLLHTFHPIHCIVLGVDGLLRQPRLDMAERVTYLLRSLAALDSVQSVLIETRSPSHPLLQSMVQQNPLAILERELASRQRWQLPPAVPAVTFEAATSGAALAELRDWLSQAGAAADQLVGPLLQWRNGRPRERYRLSHPPLLPWRQLPTAWLLDPDSVD